MKSSSADRSSSPHIDETFDLVVDDPGGQQLKLIVKDDDHGWTDPTIGVFELPLEDAAFVRWAVDDCWWCHGTHS
jgi:hypothetical protein